MSESEQSGAGRREVAYRLFAAEFDDADFSHSESDEERAPNYVITPTGARVNRLFVVGVLTEVEGVSEDVLRARVVDPTGAFVLYAGQYQPDEQAFLDGARTPMFVAVTGKARTFQPDDSEQVFTSVRPESISEVDAETRDRWTVQTAEQTIERVGHMATALSLDVRGEDLRVTLEDNGIDDGLAAGTPLAIEHYGTTGAYLSALRDLSVEAAEVVADERDEVQPLSLAPGEGDAADLQALADTSVEASVSAADVAEAASGDSMEAVEPGTPSSDASPADSTASTTEHSGPTADESAPATDPETAVAAETEAGNEPDPTPSSDVEAGTETAETEIPEAEPTSETATTGSTEGDAEPGVTPDKSAQTPDETPAADTADSAAAEDDIGDFEPGEFELDEDEREEIEEEYGTEFQTGTDVPDPGEADIETPDPEELAESEAEADADAPAAVESDPDGGSEDLPADSEQEPEAEPAAEPDDATEEPAEDIDLEDVTVETMGELDDGDGADRETLVETVAERYGTSPGDVEDAIQDALMGGRCYEPDDATVKPI